MSNVHRCRKDRVGTGNRDFIAGVAGESDGGVHSVAIKPCEIKVNIAKLWHMSHEVLVF